MKMRATFFGLAARAGGRLRRSPLPAELKIATWNLEWFMKPETLRALTPACTPRDAPRDGARRAIPCDVAHELARSGEDIAALRSYARILDADIVSLQEVDGADAARLVFPDYEFCFSGRIARAEQWLCHPAAACRSPAARTLRTCRWATMCAGASSCGSFPARRSELRLLSVHLKSGCARDALDSAKPSCAELAPPAARPRALDRRTGGRT